MTKKKFLRGVTEQVRKEELLFVNKKKQKNFDFLDVARPVGFSARARV
jgi:hypothetical protein